MKKFLVIYNAPAEAMAKMATATPEEKKAGMGAWMDWKAKLGDAVLNFGSPLMPGARILPDGSIQKAETETTGYSEIQAESLENAKAMLKSHPHLQWEAGCAIEVYECISMG